MFAPRPTSLLWPTGTVRKPTSFHGLAVDLGELASDSDSIGKPPEDHVVQVDVVAHQGPSKEELRQGELHPPPEPAHSAFASF